MKTRSYLENMKKDELIKELLKALIELKSQTIWTEYNASSFTRAEKAIAKATYKGIRE